MNSITKQPRGGDERFRGEEQARDWRRDLQRAREIRGWGKKGGHVGYPVPVRRQAREKRVGRVGAEKPVDRVEVEEVQEGERPLAVLVLIRALSES